MLRGNTNGEFSPTPPPASQTGPGEAADDSIAAYQLGRDTMTQARLRYGGKIWLGLIGLLAMLLVVVWNGFRTSPPVSSATVPLPPPPQLNGIYLADPGSSVINPEEARLYGVQVVNSVPDLVVGATGADAIIIDGSIFGDVDTTWLATQLQQGKVIAALNVPFARLAELPGYRQPPAPLAYRQEWGGRPFFSIVRQWKDDSGAMHLSTGSDYLHSAGDFFRRVYQVTPAGVDASSPGALSPVPTQPAR
jgi:hypothetical protein